MTQTMGSSVSGGGAGSGSTGGTKDAAKDEARGVAQDAAQGARSTAETAREQAQQVAGEASSQARHLAEQARQELTSQGTAQKERAATGLRSVADELTSMVDGNQQAPGVVGDVAREAAERVRTAADWLESHEPGDVLEEARRFARRRPGMFLLGAAAAGFLGGRLTRGLADEVKEYAEAEQGQSSGTPGAHRAPGPPATPAPAAPLSAGTGTGVGANDPYATGASEADPVHVATKGGDSGSIDAPGEGRMP